MSRVIFVFDIDCTIADNSHRAEFLEKSCVSCLHSPVPVGYHQPCPNCGCTDSVITQASFDHFLRPDLVALDPPITAGINALQALRNRGAEIHFVTGRNEVGTGDVTKSWLKQHAGWDPTKEHLYMRQPEDAGLPASLCKENLFARLQNGLGTTHQESLFIFFEDDPHVFNIYGKYGIVVKCPGAWEYFLPKGSRDAEHALSR